MTGLLEQKSIALKGNLKDVDKKTRTIKGYFSVFDNIDSDNDIIEKGAWKKSIAERSNEIRYLYNHNWEKPLDRGSVNLKLEEDSYGLKFEAKIQKGLTYGDDLLILYESGIVDEHSVGFQTVKSHTEKSGTRMLRELKLYEGSAVTMAANPMAKLISVKSSIKENNDMVSRIVKLLKNGSLTDDTFGILEIALKQLQLQAYELGKHSYQEDEPSPGTHANEYEPLIKSINNLTF